MNILNIDVIRTIALVSVVGFHLSAPGFSFGYLGVDIFFCLSGYLCALIWSQGRDEFNASRFIIRRYIRIIGPSLLTIILFSLLFIILLPLRDLKDVGQSLISQLLIASNILFFIESDYFDVASEYKPFLHYWSLSLELQFYAILAMVLALSPSEKVMKLTISSLFLISLLIWLLDKNINRDFYWATHRLWQFLSGFLFFYATRSNKYLLEIRSVLFVASIFSFSVEYQNVFVISATCLLLTIKAPKQCLRVTRLLFSPIASRSFTIYLVHQPIIVLSRYLGFEPPQYSIYLVTIILLVTLPLYRAEKYFHIRNFGLELKKFHKIGWLYLATITIGYVSIVQPVSLFVERHRSQAELTSFDSSRECLNITGVFDPLKICNVISSEPNKQEYYFFLGDSHANSLFNGFEPTHGNAWDLSVSGCPMIFNAQRIDQKDPTRCSKYLGQIKTFLENRASRSETLVIYARLDQYYWGKRFFNKVNGQEPGPDTWIDTQGSRPIDSESRRQDFNNDIIETVEFLSEIGYKIVIVLPTPSSGQPVPVLINRKKIFSSDDGLPTIYIDAADYRRRIKPVTDVLIDYVESANSVSLLDSSEVFCKESKCSFNNQDHLYFYDSHHLTKIGAELLLEHMFNRHYQ